MYRSPSTNGLESTKELCCLIDSVTDSERSPIIFVGDLNYPEIDWPSNTVRAGQNH